MAKASSKDTPTNPGAPSSVPSAFDLFKPSWEGVKLNLTELIVLFVAPTALLSIYFMLAAGALGTNNGNSVNPAGVVLLAIGAVIICVYTVLLGPAIVHIQLKSARMEKASYESAWATSKKFWWRYLILSVTVGLTIFVGLILFIVPGLIFIRRYFLSQFALIDQDLGTRDSMRFSNELSKGRAMSVWGVIGVYVLIAIPSFVPIIGSIITFLLQIAYYCASAIRFEQLKALRPAAQKNS
ncbi:MAG TPA: hypothetical protein VHA05_03645 [Candidatus Saccharimonadales bacterium]|nr:hypothetical protein [Candidatus Saccharimonadales bacterium]